MLREGQTDRQTDRQRGSLLIAEGPSKLRDG